MSTATALSMLKAAAEPTRLRILMLLSAGELNVKDLTRILGQSQPRISRHLKLLTEAGLIERTRDGSWAYFQLLSNGTGASLAQQILSAIDPADGVLKRDRERADGVKRDREAAAQAYFQTHAAEWDRIRSLHVMESEVEAILRDEMGEGRFGLFVDLGTGTGRVLELFADRYEQGLGLDLNHSMLTYARGKLAEAGIAHAQVRYGDLYALSLADDSADAVVLHQVLHFLSEPAQAVREAARVLRPSGRIAIVDFAPHDLDFLRETYAHERLGFSDEQVVQWLTDGGLVVRSIRALAPRAGAGQDKLTVTVWTAERPASLDLGSPRKPARGNTNSVMEA